MAKGEKAKTKKEKKPPKPTQAALRAEHAKLPVEHVGLSFTDRHHVFIAKLKAGEVWAVNQLKVETVVHPARTGHVN